MLKKRTGKMRPEALGFVNLGLEPVPEDMGSGPETTRVGVTDLVTRNTHLPLLAPWKQTHTPLRSISQRFLIDSVEERERETESVL